MTDGSPRMEAARHVRAGNHVEQRLVVAECPTTEAFAHIAVHIDSGNRAGHDSTHRTPPHTMYSKSRLLVMNMCPGACVIANSGLDTITAACGVTPHAQNTGTSPGSNTGASP